MREIWLRHKNGGGRVYGENCSVDQHTYLDRSSSVGDNAEIYKSDVSNGSLICDDAIVTDSTIHSSSVEGAARVFNNSFIIGSKLSGETRIRDGVNIIEVTLNHVVVFGTARLTGPWELDARVQMHEGNWIQPPRSYVIKGGEIDCTISECIEGRFHVGCRCETYEKWGSSRYRQLLGKYAGWTPSMVEEAFSKFAMWKKCPVAT